MIDHDRTPTMLALSDAAVRTYYPRPLRNERTAHDFFGMTSPRQFGPEAFIVNYEAHAHTPAHFHMVDQFQIFYGAPGATYQRHEIGGRMLHYTDAYSTYGPFGTNDHPMQFMTLRPQLGNLTGFMPADRDKLLYRGKRQIHVDLDEQLSGVAPASGSVESVELIDRHDDGLAMTLLCLGSGATIDVADHVEIADVAYATVLDGELESDDRRFGEQSLCWMRAGHSLRVTASTERSTTNLVVMTFPSPPTPIARRDELVAAND